MRSQVRFVMHPEDEAQFARVIKSETGTVFVDGPNWHQPRPPVVNEIETAGNYTEDYLQAETNLKQWLKENALLY